MTSYRILRTFLVLLCSLPAAATAQDLQNADFALILNTPSIAEQSNSRRDFRSSQNRAALAAIRAEQQSLQSDLVKRRIPVTGSASTLVNAIFVRIPMARAAELQTVSGVRFVAYLPPLRRHLNRALDLVQASGAWSQVGGPGNA